MYELQVKKITQLDYVRQQLYCQTNFYQFDNTLFHHSHFYRHIFISILLLIF